MHSGPQVGVNAAQDSPWKSIESGFLKMRGQRLTLQSQRQARCSPDSTRSGSGRLQCCELPPERNDTKMAKEDKGREGVSTHLMWLPAHPLAAAAAPLSGLHADSPSSSTASPLCRHSVPSPEPRQISCTEMELSLNLRIVCHLSFGMY